MKDIEKEYDRVCKEVDELLKKKFGYEYVSDHPQKVKAIEDVKTTPPPKKDDEGDGKTSEEDVYAKYRGWLKKQKEGE